MRAIREDRRRSSSLIGIVLAEACLVLKASNMEPQLELRETERQNWEFFSALPDRERRNLSFGNVREMQVAEPLFEFSGACAGCGPGN